MNERAVALLEQYEFEVIRTRKGRGAILCDTPDGCLIFKEYTGNGEKLAAQDRLLKFLKENSSVRAEMIIPTKEGELSVKDVDETVYVLKTFSEGRECNINEKGECMEAVRLLGGLHECTKNYIDETGVVATACPENEYQKRNKELKKVRKYLLQRGQKTDFEIKLQDVYGIFMEQALKVTESWEKYCREVGEEAEFKSYAICHGDYKYHNVLQDNEGWCIINFEKCVKDNGIRDLYLFMRKLLEKSGWSVSLGREILEEYDKVHKISEPEYNDLYHRLAYPEKFWKIVNFYYNSRKSWIPGKNMEKLEKILKQEEARANFLDVVFGG